jgi:hypothetical protein
VSAVLLAIFISISFVVTGFSAEAHFKCVELLDNGSTLNAEPKLLELRPEFVGEKNGVWVESSSGIFGRKSPRRVFVKTRYLTDQEVLGTIADFNPDGRLVSSFFGNLDFIFIVSLDGQLRVAPKKTNDSSFTRIKHSSLAQGQPVLIAGEISLNADGKVFSISNMSGHYLPPLANLVWFREQFLPKSIRSKTKLIDVSARF